MKIKIAFVSCTRLKAGYLCSARRMYQYSPLFKKTTSYIEQQDYDDWFILSAKYGLLKQADEIEPYDLTLNNMRVSERKEWSKLVLLQIEDLRMDISQIDFYAGSKYREYLIPALEEKKIYCNVPLQGKGIGEQLQFYKENLK